MLRMGRPKTETPMADTPAANEAMPPPVAAQTAPPPPAPAASNQMPSQMPQQPPGQNANQMSNTAINQPTSTTGRAVTETETLARDIKEGALSGFVGGGTTMSGELSFKAMLRVDGHLAGRVTSQDGTLIVSAGGQVDADVSVAVAQVNGTVNGDIIASKRIELGRVARVNGNIQAPALVVEQGAVFEGSCRMVHLQEKAVETKPNYTPAASSSANAKPPVAPVVAPSQPPPPPVINATSDKPQVTNGKVN